MGLQMGFADIDVSYRKLTTDDGLASNLVMNTVQDPNGYIWISTHNGLSRYDGYSFHHIRQENSQQGGLKSNILRYLYQNPNGLLWIRYYSNEFSCLDTRTNRFVDFQPAGVSLPELSECTVLSNGETWLWQTGSGCLRVRADMKSREPKIKSCLFTEANRRLLSNDVYFVAEDSYENVWIGTSRGLALAGENSTRILLPQERFKFSISIGGQLYVITDNGNIYHTNRQGRLVAEYVPKSGHSGYDGRLGDVARWRNRLILITDGTTMQYTMGSHRLERCAELQAPNGYVYTDNAGYTSVLALDGVMTYLGRNGIIRRVRIFNRPLKREAYRPFKVATGHDGIVWISSQGNGLFVLNTKNDEEPQHFASETSENSPLSTNNIYNLSVDRDNNLWIAQANLGVVLVSMVAGDVNTISIPADDMSSKSNDIKAVCKQPDGSVLAVNNEGRLVWLDDRRQQPVIMKEAGSDVASVLRMADGTLWIGTRHDGVTIGNRSYRHDREDSRSPGNNHIRQLVADQQGRVWMACGGSGLDLAEKQDDGSYRFRHFFHEGESKRKVLVIYSCRNGSLIVGTDKGIVVFDPNQLVTDTTAYQHYYDEENIFDVHDITEDQQGHIIYATAGGGIYLSRNVLADDSLKFIHFTTENGLSDMTCNSLVNDNHGYVWIGTQWGIARFDPRTQAFNRYFLAPTKLGNVVSAQYAAATSTGRLVFGSSNGIIAFSPTQIVNMHHQDQKPTVTNIFVNGYQLQSVEQLAEKALSYDENSLAIYFSNFSYGKEQTTEYSYMLEGADRGWSQPGKDNFAIYRNLKPGTYTFRLRSRDSNFSSVYTETQLQFTISQPWWNTWWAWLFYLGIAAATVWYIVHNLRAQYLLRRRLEMERQLTQFKSDFFMNISHELRTPLTLIQGAAEHMEKLKQIPGELKQPLRNMLQSSGRLQRLVNQLLTYNKLQSHKLQLQLTDTDIVKFVRDIADTFLDMAYNHDISLTVKPWSHSYVMPIDRDMVDKMVYNLLSNAFKYTPDKGSIAVALRLNDGLVSISIADTGIGITDEQRRTLFQRYARSVVAADSIGIGLNLTYQLAQVHHGQLTFEDNPGGGSIFTIELPADGSSYQSEDWAGALSPSPYTHMSTLAAPLSSLHSPLNNRSLLLVDDDDDMREFLQQELSHYFRTTACSNGQQALDHIQRERPDIIVSDVCMPVMDGFELLRRVRNDDELFDIPFILLTAMDSAANEARATGQGADAYLPKPFSLQLLVMRCLKLLEQYERLRRTYAQERTADMLPPVIGSEIDRKFREQLDAKLAAQLGNEKLNIDELARSMNFGHTQFYRRVNEVTGMSPGEYIRRHRMEAAASLLVNETLTIAEVAYRVGFSDPVYFGRCFKQHFGITPSKYRKGDRKE